MRVLLATLGLFVCITQTVFALDAITSMCFKVMANAEVCGCATAKLSEDVSDEAFDVYQSVVTRTLSQTNVPRNRAWQDALDAEASHRQIHVDELTALTNETSTQHNVVLHACVDQQARN